MHLINARVRVCVALFAGGGSIIDTDASPATDTQRLQGAIATAVLQHEASLDTLNALVDDGPLASSSAATTTTEGKEL